MRKSLLFALLLALPLGAAPVVQSISPSSGPTTGGTEITIKGTFDPAKGPIVIFGDQILAAPARMIDANTIVTVTPEHIPGVATVWVRESGVESNRDQKFAFVGDIPASYERILIPIFVPPVRGAFGSEFHTTLRLWSTAGGELVYGINPESSICPVTICQIWNPIDTPLRVTGNRSADDQMPEPIGTPGRFVFLRDNHARNVAMQLRVADITRDHLNFGTEIPIVRENDLVTNGDSIALLGVPLDPRYRNTLRIYSTEALGVFVRIGNEERFVMLRPGRDLFEPAYAEIGNFPTGTGTVRVTITPPAGSPNPFPPTPYPPVWAFISVTNNDTQTITTITPQR